MLEDLSKQTFKNFEVIHIDGQSTDKTLEEAKKFSKKLQLTSQTIDQQNVAAQRNTGAKVSRGEWVIFMDADNRLRPSFLQDVHQQLTNTPHTDVFTCLIDVDKDDLLKIATQRAINYVLELYFLFNKPSGFGALIGCRKKILDEFSFDEQQKIYEDSLFLNALKDAGYHFQLFKKPTYNYSLRRIEKEGTLKMLRISAQMNLQYLRGKDFQQQDFGYTMQGGDYYDQPSIFHLVNLKSMWDELSQQQKTRAKKLLKMLRELKF